MQNSDESNSIQRVLDKVFVEFNGYDRSSGTIRIGKSIFEICRFLMGIAHWAGGGECKALDDLEHFFSPSKLALSCFKGGQNACQDGSCTF